MDKGNIKGYWELHKEVWIDTFEGLDKVVRDKIMQNPHGPESKRVERIVDRILYKVLIKDKINKKRKKKKRLATV